MRGDRGDGKFLKAFGRGGQKICTKKARHLLRSSQSRLYSAGLNCPPTLVSSFRNSVELAISRGNRNNAFSGRSNRGHYSGADQVCTLKNTHD